EIDKAIKNVISNSNFILGEELSKFESEFANYCNKKYGVGVGNGTDAIKIALMALDAKENDEVIIPVNTAIPTAMAIKDAGAEICFVDCDDDYLIDVNDIEKKINNKTKFIIPVHLYGKACGMDRIFEIANKYGLKVIEDCCQAHGSLF
ncbi:MAG: aminotransferase class I/II-fold pyridoxal phosphate-dependent enzyme, partial [Nanoarchaeota archaeon]